MYILLPPPATCDHSSVLPSSVPGLSVSPQCSEASCILPVLTQNDDGGGKQKEARLCSVFIFPCTGQGRGHGRLSCAQSPTAAEGGGEGGVTFWGWRWAADVMGWQGLLLCR